MSKYSGIGDLIDENIELKSKIRIMEKNHLKNILNYLKMWRDSKLKGLRGFNIEKAISDLEEELEKLA